MLKESGDATSACFELLHAIWGCDDLDDSLASELRKILGCELETQIRNEYDENLDIMRLDVLRRSGQFEKLLSDYTGKSFSQKLFNDICRFQIQKAKDKDDRCYTVADAIEFAKK